MKSAYILAASAALVASVQAQCECDPADSACLSECGKSQLNAFLAPNES